jgi:hypothetical protein
MQEESGQGKGGEPMDEKKHMVFRIKGGGLSIMLIPVCCVGIVFPGDGSSRRQMSAWLSGEIAS